MNESNFKNQIDLSSSVTILPHIGAIYGKKLLKLGISTVKDLIYHFPLRYEDTRTITPIKDIYADPTKIWTIKGYVKDITNTKTKTGKIVTIALIDDRTAKAQAMWFNQPFLISSIRKNSDIILSGKTIFYRSKLTFYSPQYEIVYKGRNIHLGVISPVYPLTEGISQKWMRRRIKYVVDQIDKGIYIEETLPLYVRNKYRLPLLKDAIKMIHTPQTYEDVLIAKRRLGFEEIFWIMVNWLKRKINFKRKKAYQITIDRNLHNLFLNSLQFTPTKSQLKAIEDVYSDISKDIPMDRLISGEVGSGKTLVAVAGAIQVASSKKGVVIMTPTTILAQQHYKTVKKLLKNFNIKVSLLIGDSKREDKEEALESDVIIGTQALLYHLDRLKNIALVVIDEEHRFGVEQRDTIVREMGKIPFIYTPHRLTLTATPIPRTMALVFFGDQDLSTLKELPRGRKKVITKYISPQKISSLYEWIKKYLNNKKRRFFIVCPLIEESEKLQTKALETEYEKLKKVFSNYKIDKLHGKMKEQEKIEVIEKFREGETQILICTPVIEVGIDIPTANGILIEGAERFGLSQLHQLRGRVGRGEEQAYCFVSTENQSIQTIKRMKYFCEINNGFKLAEYDLENRGPGEIYGKKQSGMPNLKVASLTDTSLIKEAKEAAIYYLKKEEKSSAVIC